MLNLKVICCLAFLCCLTACASVTVATAKYQSSYPFSALKSYSTYERNSQFSEFQNMADATRNAIELAIEQALDSQGLVYQDNDSADIVIGYHVIKSPKELKKYNQGVKYCGPCLSAGNAKKGKNAWPMQPGSLILDAVSRQSQRSIWRSVYPLKIRDKDNSFDVQEKISSAIKFMVKTMPSSKL